LRRMERPTRIELALKPKLACEAGFSNYRTLNIRWSACVSG
jgi:hypothetical protein